MWKMVKIVSLLGRQAKLPRTSSWLTCSMYYERSAMTTMTKTTTTASRRKTFKFTPANGCIGQACWCSLWFSAMPAFLALAPSSSLTWWKHVEWHSPRLWKRSEKRATSVQTRDSVTNSETTRQNSDFMYRQADRHNLLPSWRSRVQRHQEPPLLDVTASKDQTRLCIQMRLA